MHQQTPSEWVEIIEIIGPSEQGLARPYKCRGADGHIYYVKGMQSGRDSLYKEWLCSYLAQQIGLHIPPFKVVNISDTLLAEAPSAFRDLGACPAFGSQEYTPAVWLEPHLIHHVSQAERQLILAFDWWVANSDRTTGNSNLLYDYGHNQSQHKVIVIDHNNALDDSLRFDEFITTHIFSHECNQVFYDLVAVAELQHHFVHAAKGLATWLQHAPQQWQWINPECDIPTSFDREAAIRSLIHRAQHFTGGEL